MLVNGQAGQPDGKCNRKETAYSAQADGKGETVW